MGDRSQAIAFAEKLTPEDIEALNERFRQQVLSLNVYYDCRHCSHLDEDTRRCSLEYPNDQLWEAASRGHALTPAGDLVFCKYFELD